MADAKLKWRNASKDNPGYTVWYAVPERDDNVLYIVRRKRKHNRSLTRPEVTNPPSTNIWRVFMRPRPGESARTIFVAETLDGKDGAKQFVQSWEEMICASLELEHAPTV